MPPKKYLMYISQNYSYAMLRPLQIEVLARGGEVAWFLEGDEVSANYLDKAEKHLESISDVKKWMPDIVLVPGNIVPSFIPGLKVGVFHGFNSGKRGNDAHFKVRQCFDLYCTQGPNTTNRFVQLSKQYKTFSVKETGWAVLDPLFTLSDNNPYQLKGDDRQTILFCSTFSAETSYAKELFSTIKLLSQSAKYRWLVQFHPKMAIETVNLYKSIQNANLQFIETDDVIPLLQAADIMICDTSSIMTMFLLQKKPVIAYKNKTINDSFLHIDNVDDLTKAISDALSPSRELMRNIDTYCEQTHPFVDGKSSSRVIDACESLKAQGGTHLKKKPINLIRQLKLRKKLNFWKI